MLLKRFYDEQLAQASYLLGCAATGEAIVVDANRDVQQYVDAAAAEGLRVTHVTETHIHADYLSGSRELAQRTGAALLLSGEGGPDWQYAFAEAAHATLLHDGDAIRVGNIRLDVLHTPGHTPEHLAFLVTDGAVATEPFAILTGDFVFVGDVGRPDLLEKAAKVADTMRDAARTLYRSLARFRTLPDFVQVFPGHGAGSACGKALGALPSSTVGYERRTNWALQPMDEAAFVAAVLEGQPDPPTYFAMMKQLNREGPPLLGPRAPVGLLAEPRLSAARAKGALLVDVRPAADYAAGHLPGALSLPLGRSFTTWAGWLLPYGTDLILIAADAAAARQARDWLALIGLDRVVGFLGPAALGEVPAGTLRGIRQIEADELYAQLPTVAPVILDVRNDAEHAAGHLAGALHIPLGQLPHRLAEVPTDRPVVVHCAAGLRSAMAAGVLDRAGVADLRNLVGGYQAWVSRGHPVEHGAAAGAR